MGEANQRGSLEDRIEQAQQREEAEREVLARFTLSDGEDGSIDFRTDIVIGHEASPSVILTRYIMRNMRALLYIAESENERLLQAVEEAKKPESVIDTESRPRIVGPDGSLVN